MTNLTEEELRLRRNEFLQNEMLYEAFKNFVKNGGHNTFVTLTTNGGAKSLDKMRKILKEYMYGVEYECLRCKRSLGRIPAHKRIEGWFFAELLNDNAHWHGIIRLPSWIMQLPIRRDLALSIMMEKWPRYAPAGNAKLPPITDNIEGGVLYQTKERWRDDFFETVVNLREFWSVKKPERTA